MAEAVRAKGCRAVFYEILAIKNEDALLGESILGMLSGE
jgi:hypothetical protein